MRILVSSLLLLLVINQLLISQQTPIDKRLQPYVNIHIVGETFHISVELQRTVNYWANGKEYYTIGGVWNKSSTGTHADRGSFILDGLDELMDEFLNEYLEVNVK